MNSILTDTELEKRFIEATDLHQQGKIEEACLIYLELHDMVEESPLINYNLGLALFELCRYRESCLYYRQALQYAPDQVDILYNLALSHQKGGEFGQAVEIYTQALGVSPRDVDCLYNLACCYMDMQDDDEAITTYRQVLDIDHRHLGSLSNIAFVHHRNGQYDQAAKYYTRLLDLAPDHQAARHMLDSLEGVSRQSPPAEYIRDMFDNYSARYDDSLVTELEYTAPAIMREKVDSEMTLPLHSALGLDLGCGTGLSGLAFSSLCKTLTGVDISPKMVEIAGGKKIYSSLYVAEILEYLLACQEKYSLVIAADVFGYVGRLDEVFFALSRVVLPQACFCFSTENTDKVDYLLRKTGRFAHSPEYIENLCGRTGWRLITHAPVNLRREKNDWINGNVYIVVKK